jgi:cobalt-zinc-cadmium efflux system membrane fusion protein
VARQHLERQRKLRAEGINSQRSLLEAELTFKQAEAEREAALSRLRVFGGRRGGGPDMDLVSPISGMVVERHATRGENVSPRTTLFVVADLSRVWVMGRVYEQQIAQVKPGMPALLRLNAYPGRTWRGEVDFVGAALDEATRTLPVRVELENPEGLLRPGLFGSLRLLGAEEGGGGVLLPREAVQTWDGRAVVFVPGDHPGEFKAQPITTAREGDGQVEVVRGLSAGQEVVVSGAFVLKSELVRSQLGHGHAH